MKTDMMNKDSDEIMAQAAVDAPDLSDMPTEGICVLLLTCGKSHDPSDMVFAKACRDELSRRKDDEKP